MFLEIACYLPYYLWKTREAQRLSPSGLEALQNKRLRAVVEHAYENVPYYHKLFSSIKLKPDDIKTKKDLVRIPVTTKKILQKLPLSERVAKGVEITKCIKSRTSGSTGEPLDVFLSKKELSYRIAMQTRVYGLNVINKKANILSPESFGRKDSYLSILRKGLNYLGLWRRYDLSIFEEPQQLLLKLMKIRPDVIEALPSIMKLISEYIRSKNTHGLTPKLMFTRAELLSKRDRHQIETAFGTKLTDLYGIVEFGIVAWECEKHQGYHINSDMVVMEAVKDNRQVYGEEGEVICTDLTNYTMPLIRYALRDRAILTKERCRCGRSFPLIKLIEGRSDDFITLPSGKIISPILLEVSLKKINGICQYKLVQEKIDTFNVQIVKGQDFREARIDEFERVLRRILGSDIQVNINVVDEIYREKSGKIRSIISKLPVNTLGK